ncbi:methyl-accepting chemotaxis protein [Phytohalomonas tamaricis]|uniref:methyl-accepting chemotaxis protein n=1 Tax=Phytohalomonas tamaricis TaxID=2081032 RepID=UPI000D0B6262|nr:methyl-accepting chemotaxis protein [Phytohalomonas tamaricis]
MLSSLKRRIQLACVTIVILAMALGAVVSYFSVNSYYQEAIDDNLHTVTSSNAKAIEQWIATRGAIITAARDQIGAEPPLSTLEQLAASGGFRTAFLGYSSNVLISSDGFKPPADYDVRQRPWYLAAVKQGDVVVSQPFTDAGTGQTVVSFSAPVMRDGELLAVIGGNIVVDNIIADVEAIRPTPSSFAFLSSGTDTLIAHPDATLVKQPLTRLSEQLTPARMAELRSGNDWLRITLNDRAKHLDVVPIAGTNWELGVALDEAESSVGMRAIIKSSLITLIIVALVAAAALGLWLTRAFRGLERVRDAMIDIGSGEGDLTRRLPAEGRDEVSQIAQAFNVFIAKINGVILEVHHSSETVKLAAAEISSGSNDLSQRTEQTAASLEQSAASMEQLTGTVETSAASARQASQLAVEAARSAEHNGGEIERVVITMGEIRDASSRIVDIIGVIDSIAFQTNLLALNASVEAARAGEQGRGFAVVAEEVRSLANRSTQAAKDIKALIDASSVKTESGAILVEGAGKAMKELVERVSRVTAVISEISTASDEQSLGIGQVNQAVAQLDSVTQQNAAMVEETAAAAQSLSLEALRLAEIVGQFRLAR